MTFAPGAFNPGKTVQPVVIRSVTTTRSAHKLDKQLSIAHQYPVEILVLHPTGSPTVWTR